MRSVLVLLTGLVLAQASIAKADIDEDLDETDYASSFEMADLDAARVAGWNRWSCTARTSSFPVRFFRGSSYYFRQGSGEGQEAKRIAQKIAQRNCEFSGARGCVSDLSNCTVESH